MVRSSSVVCLAKSLILLSHSCGIYFLEWAWFFEMVVSAIKCLNSWCSFLKMLSLCLFPSLPAHKHKGCILHQGIGPTHHGRGREGGGGMRQAFSVEYPETFVFHHLLHFWSPGVPTLLVCPGRLMRNRIIMYMNGWGCKCFLCSCSTVSNLDWVDQMEGFLGCFSQPFHYKQASDLNCFL